MIETPHVAGGAAGDDGVEQHRGIAGEDQIAVVQVRGERSSRTQLDPAIAERLHAVGERRPEVDRVRPDDHFCDAVMGEEAAHAHHDTLFHGFLGEEQADLPAARRQRQAHGGKVALPALHNDMIHTAARIVIDAPRGFGFNDGQVIVEDRDRDNGHAVRDEHDRRAEPAGRQVQRDAVRVAVAGHHGEIEVPARKELAVPPVVREQLHDAQRPEHAVAAHQGSRQPDRAPAVCDRGARKPGDRRGHRGEARFEAQLGPLAAGQHPAEIATARRSFGRRAATTACPSPLVRTPR